MPNNDATAVMRRPSYEGWSQCVCLLLGRREGEAAHWFALYRAGLTPLQAARQAAFGDRAADTMVWV
jgi:hypothetical protein